MKDVVTPPEELEFEEELTCEQCHSTFVAETEDLQVDRFKARGTYWFDGSGEATATTKFFVACPACNGVVFTTKEIPILVDRHVRARSKSGDSARRSNCPKCRGHYCFGTDDPPSLRCV
jgi:uncharacterized protein with PIN domain